ncbi:hypothetical protein TNCV_1255021 [Trichonephila clavipes]|nr:hypothetical protein TNCV_1255021 [Trichonephila clavipes]
MHHHTSPERDIMIWSGIGFHCRTPLVRITGTLNSQCYIYELLETLILPYIACPHQPYSNRIMHDHTWHAMFKSSSLPIRLNCFIGLLVLPVYRKSKMRFNACTTTGHACTTIHPPLLPQFNNFWKPHCSCTPRIHQKSLRRFYAETCSSGYSQQWPLH